ncbi:MAG: prolipoprotein diacylglyceryl transferase [Flavobacteriaceae bacterium]|nr:prolipoprotein diacylglyceryl transferase [Flavobacteriaceae bacterium]
MESIKNRWDIQKKWQYIFPLLGYFGNLASAYLLAAFALKLFKQNGGLAYWLALLFTTLAFHFLLLRFFLWCFDKLKNKWVTQYRWEMIAIFIVFAITGSLSAKLAVPLMNWIGIYPETLPSFWYWCIRIFIILPIYQVLLIVIGWLFGQYRFFYSFEKKMLKRLGIKI